MPTPDSSSTLDSPRSSASTSKKGLKIPRRFTQKGVSPYEMFTYERRTSVIRERTGKVVAEFRDVEVPSHWSQIATDILAQKYFRKTGVPDSPDGAEHSVKQVVHRLAYTWTWWGKKLGYFASEEDAQAFYDELVYMLLDQRAAPNSPQWFNTGLYLVYGIQGPPQGHWYVDEEGNIRQSTSAYERPQVHACFILSIQDDLVNEGGIMDLWVREARIFKYGSGTGSNFSAIRAKGEPLSGGGTSSGLLTFLKIGDAAAGAIKSGGTTRRAAKMVCLDADHPEILEFVRWKAEEEEKARMMLACGFSLEEALEHITGQNANLSVRLPARFFEILEADGEWVLTARTTGKPLRRIRARELWDAIAESAWACADPGVQYDTTINEWHTCPADEPIRASNPCSEYMFIDDTACNLASLNLLKFWDEEKGEFQVEDFIHACRLWTIVLDISVSMAQYPDRRVAEKSHQYRTLGLGYANLGALLMSAGLPYHSEQGRQFAGVITAIMTGVVYRTSTELAEHLGPFPAFERNRKHMLRVIANHRACVYGDASMLEGLTVRPRMLQKEFIPPDLYEKAVQIWDEVYERGKKYGFRNAQATCIAPTGTIGLLMDCDTTGIEPDFSLVKFKKLAGGGYFKIVNQSVPRALRKLGYTPEQIQEIVEYIVGTGSLQNTPHINVQTLRERGLTDEEIQKAEQALASATHLRDAFTVWVLGKETFQRLQVPPARYEDPSFSLLEFLGFTPREIEEASRVACGHMTIEGAPHLREEHLPVFDCAVPSPGGKRFLPPEAHVLMMAAVQPFISGAISKTVNLPESATVEDIQKIYRMGWELGLKALALYRDRSKITQPLSTELQDGNGSVGQRGIRYFRNPHLKKQVLEALRWILREHPEEILPELQQMPHISIKKPLPLRRKGITWKAKIGGQSIFIRTGEYEDGRIGELFIDMYKEGASFRSLLNCFAIAISVGLQHGVPLEEFVNKFVYTRFDPSGPTQHPYIRNATSVLDFVFRLLAAEYLGRTDLLHEPPPRERLRIYELQAVRSREQENGHPEKTENDRTPRNSPGGSSSSGSSEAEVCPVCGHLMVRTGTCYTCPNCGTNSGCS